MTTPPCPGWPGTWAWTGTPCGTASKRGHPTADRPRPADRREHPRSRRAHLAAVPARRRRPGRDRDGRPDPRRARKLHARLLDVVPGSTGTAYATWLKCQHSELIVGVQRASLDPFRGYANAIRDELPDAVAVLDAFHVVKLGTQVGDGVHRR